MREGSIGAGTSDRQRAPQRRGWIRVASGDLPEAAAPIMAGLGVGATTVVHISSGAAHGGRSTPLDGVTDWSDADVVVIRGADGDDERDAPHPVSNVIDAFTGTLAEHVPSLSAPLRHALHRRSEPGLGDEPASSTSTVALRSLWRTAALCRPVILVVADADRLDPRSARLIVDTWCGLPDGVGSLIVVGDVDLATAWQPCGLVRLGADPTPGPTWWGDDAGGGSTDGNEIGHPPRRAVEPGLRRCLDDLCGGDPEAAAQHADVAVEQATESSDDVALALALALRCRVEALLGRFDRATADGVTASRLAERIDRGDVRGPVASALGFAALSAGDTASALTHLERAGTLAADGVPPTIPGLPLWAPDLVEALVRDGRGGDGGSAMAVLERATSTGSVWARGVAARCRGMVAAADYEREFVEALRIQEGTPMPFEYARTQLAYGRRLAGDDASRARRSFDEARLAFAEVGAVPWQTRATSEIEHLGAPPLRAGERLDRLTERERQIARRAAAGQTSREIAAELFLSPRTVDANLGRVYRKLGVKSRAALAAILFS